MSNTHSETYNSKAQATNPKGMKKYRFRPRLIPTVVTLLILPILLSLGFWQLHRAEEKAQMLKAFNKRIAAKPITLNQLVKPFDQHQYSKLKVEGHYLNQQQILLDNQVHQHQVGYQVVTLFKPEHSKRYLLINRGWIPQGKTRQSLPQIKAVNGLQSVTGMISIPSKSIVLKQINSQVSWPYRVQSINVSELSEILHKPLYPFVVKMDKANAHGFVRDWKIVSMKPEKHIGYAVQWFALALTLLIIYIVVNVHKEGTNNNE